MADALPAPGSLPPGRRVYAIGDIHGCLDKLVDLHFRIARDLAIAPARDSVLVHLGDYIDRGRDSAEVVRLLSGATLAAPVSRRVDLMGNHEAMMLAALDGVPEAAGQWVDNGGDHTLRSWGVADPYAIRPAEWRARVPADQLAWVRALALTHREGDYLFVHAGLRPGVSIRGQSRDDLLWIREPFLSDTAPREAVVVHGHTPVKSPEVRPNRINIDTGAVMGGRLTCLVLEENRLRFLEA